MNNSPKRRKSKDNPYTIYIINNKYIIEFIDGTGVIQKINVSKEIYESFDKFELIDKKQMNELERHIASYDLSDEYIIKNRVESVETLEDEVIMKVTFQELREAIEQLPDIQKRRIKMYYYDNLNEYQIAEKENATQQSVNIVLKRAIINLRKILKNLK